MFEKKKLWHINDCIVFSLNLRNILIVGKFVSKITKESNINRGMKETFCSNVLNQRSEATFCNIQSRYNATLS